MPKLMTNERMIAVGAAYEDSEGIGVGTIGSYSYAT